jgi:hypothetical protein
MYEDNSMYWSVLIRIFKKKFLRTILLKAAIPPTPRPRPHPALQKKC